MQWRPFLVGAKPGGRVLHGPGEHGNGTCHYIDTIKAKTKSAKRTVTRASQGPGPGTIPILDQCPLNILSSGVYVGPRLGRASALCSYMAQANFEVRPAQSVCNGGMRTLYSFYVFQVFGIIHDAPTLLGA